MSDDFASIIRELIGRVEKYELSRNDLERALAAKEIELAEASSQFSECLASLNRLEEQLGEVKNERDRCAKEKVDAQRIAHESARESEATMRQMHQVQEELEYYFLLSRKQSQLLDSSAELQQKAAKLLAFAHKI